ncbi:hypothetical protein L9F63_027655, partial [Diploptera punctata]
DKRFLITAGSQQLRSIDQEFSRDERALATEISLWSYGKRDTADVLKTLLKKPQ